MTSENTFLQALTYEVLPAICERRWTDLADLLERRIDTERKYFTFIGVLPRWAAIFAMRIAEERPDVAIPFPSVVEGRAGDIAMRMVSAACRGDDGDITAAIRAMTSWPEEHARPELTMSLAYAVADAYDTCTEVTS